MCFYYCLLFIIIRATLRGGNRHWVGLFFSGYVAEWERPQRNGSARSLKALAAKMGRDSNTGMRTWFCLFQARFHSSTLKSGGTKTIILSFCVGTPNSHCTLPRWTTAYSGFGVGNQLLVLLVVLGAAVDILASTNRDGTVSVLTSRDRLRPVSARASPQGRFVG